MAASKPKAEKKRREQDAPRYEVLNVKDPEMFSRLFAAARKRKLPKMSLTALFRFVAAEWLEYQEDDEPKQKKAKAKAPKAETPTKPV